MERKQEASDSGRSGIVRTETGHRVCLLGKMPTSLGGGHRRAGASFAMGTESSKEKGKILLDKDLSVEPRVKGRISKIPLKFVLAQEWMG